jgi:hypothetical protein
VARRAELLALATAIAALTGPAAAGTFNILVAPDNGAAIENVKLDATPLNLTAAGGGAWTFAIPAGAVSVPMTISLPAPTTDDEPFRMTVNVPFYWNSGSARTLAAAIAPRQVSSVELYGLRHTGSDSLAGTLDRRVALNEITRVGWKELWAEARNRNSDDVDIVLLYVISSKDLVLNNFVEPTAEMDAAVDIVDNLVKANSPLFRNAAALANAKKAVADYRDARHTQQQHIVDELSDAVGHGQRGDNCDRAKSVNDYLSSLSTDDRAVIDSSGALEVKNLATLTVCLRHDLSAAADLSAAEAAATRTSAQTISSQIKAVVPAYVGKVGTFDTRAKLARNGGIDLDNLLIPSAIN